MNLASLAFQSSYKSSAALIDAIVSQGAVSLADHFAHLHMVHAAVIGAMKISINCLFLLCYPVCLL